MKMKDRISEREYQGRLESLPEKRLQHATAAAEITRDRNQKAESAEKEDRKKFWVHAIKHDVFRLMCARPRFLRDKIGGRPHWRWPSRVSQRLPHRRRYGRG